MSLASATCMTVWCICYQMVTDKKSSGQFWYQQRWCDVIIIWHDNIRERLNEFALCDKVCQSLVAGRWISPGTPVSSTNKTDLHDITEILLKVALKTITLTLPLKWIHQIGLYNNWDIILTDSGYPVKALWFYYSQRLLNYFSFQYFDFMCTLRKDIPETHRAL